MIIKNKFIPFGNYKAINIFGIIFTKSDLTDVSKNHENIHSALILECAIVLGTLITLVWGIQWAWLAIPSFYVWYGLEYLIIRLLRIKDKLGECYHDVSFEEEAHNNDNNLQYLKNR